MDTTKSVSDTTPTTTAQTISNDSKDDIKENKEELANNSNTQKKSSKTVNINKSLRYKTLSRTAHNKMALHALKHLSCPVLGLLIGISFKSNPKGKQFNIHIMDAIPLLHNYFSSMVVEVAFLQIEEWLKNESKKLPSNQKLRIVGVYFANRNEHSHEKNTSALIIAAQLVKEFSRNGVFLAQIVSERINAAFLSQDICVDFYMNRNGGDSTNAKDWREFTDVHLVANANGNLTDLMQLKNIGFKELHFGSLVKRKQERNIYDFEEHLDDQTKDWRNNHLFE